MSAWVGAARWAGGCAAGALALLLAGCWPAPLPAQASASPQAFSQIERGRYLVTVGDCSACHTDPGSGKPFAGGRAIATPFGKILAANITPDRETGIGDWTDEEFDAALRRGRSREGSYLYPAMPYVYYARMPRADVMAMRAWLATLEPVRNEVRSNQLPFPFNIRGMMRIWNAMYFDASPFRPDPRRSAAWNRGAYIVLGPGHCAACHTPKSPLGGDESNHALRGYALQGWFAPDITNANSRGLARWSAEDLTAYLKTGHNRFAAASGPMAEEVMDSSSKMTQEDLAAIATYLKDLPGHEESVRPVAAQDPVMQAGAAIYRDECSACHAPDGRGAEYLFPNLAASPAVVQREPTSLIRVILHGANTVGTREEPTAPQMPSYGWQLNDVQVAAVATFVRNSWGQAAGAVSADDVHKARRAGPGGGD